MGICERAYKEQVLYVRGPIELSNHGRFFIEILGKVKGYVYLSMPYRKPPRLLGPYARR